jgi:hypothetical protein
MAGKSPASMILLEMSQLLKPMHAAPVWIQAMMFS